MVDGGDVVSGEVADGDPGPHPQRRADGVENDEPQPVHAGDAGDNPVRLAQTLGESRERNDDAAALFLQVWHRVLDRQECSGQIVREGACPILQRELLNRRPDAVDARIGEDDIHPAPAINNLLDGALHLVLLCNISDNGHALVAIALNLVRCLLYLTGGMTERSDACTLLCK